MELEARQHVADVPLLEEAQRQPDQVVEQPRAHLEVQRVLHDQGDMRPQRCCRDVDDGEQAETRAPSASMQVDIAARDHLVDGELHVERGGDDEQLEDERTA